MSLKIVHFIVFIITSLMFFVFALICWKQSTVLENSPEMFPLSITFGIGSVGLLIYSFWYLKKAKNTIV
jgi:hypothetical protein